MSEYSPSPIGLAERLRPDITPEMGFQSYELLSGDSEYRKTQERLFLAGKVRNPHLDYPKLDENLLHRGIAQLDMILSESRTVDDSLGANIHTSAGGHLPVVCHSKRSSACVIFRVIKETDHHRVRDDHSRSSGVGAE